LMRLMNLNRRDLALRFGKPERTTSRIMSLQEQKTPVTQFSNSGYVLWDGGTTDPNDSTDITNTPKVNGEATGDSLLDCLRQVDLIINKPEKSSPIISVRIRQRVKLTAKGRLNQCGMYQTTLTVPGQDLFQPGIAHEPRISATAVSRITVRQESSRVRAYVPKIDSQRTRASG
jgi:hypothetical protein